MSKKYIIRKKIWLMLLIFILTSVMLGPVAPYTNIAEAADNGLAAKPYMGWSS